MIEPVEYMIARFPLGSLTGIELVEVEIDDKEDVEQLIWLEAPLSINHHSDKFEEDDNQEVLLAILAIEEGLPEWRRESNCWTYSVVSWVHGCDVEIAPEDGQEDCCWILGFLDLDWRWG